MSYLLHRTDFVDKQLSKDFFDKTIELFGNYRLKYINIEIDTLGRVDTAKFAKEKKNFRATVFIAPGWYLCCEGSKQQCWNKFIPWLGWNTLSWQIVRFSCKASEFRQDAFEGAGSQPPVAIAPSPANMADPSKIGYADYIGLVQAHGSITDRDNMVKAVESAASGAFSEVWASRIVGRNEVDYAEPMLPVVPVPVLLPEDSSNPHFERLRECLKGPDMLFCIQGKDSNGGKWVAAHFAEAGDDVTMAAKAIEIAEDPKIVSRCRVVLFGFNAPEDAGKGSHTLAVTVPNKDGDRKKEKFVIERHVALVYAEPPLRQFVALWLFCTPDRPKPKPSSWFSL